MSTKIITMKGFVSSFFLILTTGISYTGSTQEMEGTEKAPALTLFLSGDVMVGRGIDQALPHSVEPVLYEPYVQDARSYIQLAEKENGELDLPLSYEYIWGDALKVWKEFDPDLKLINLETSITTSEIPWKGKGIHYRMHPKNIELLKVAGIDHVSLANNHIIDWGRPGLEETLNTLEKADIKASGAGKTRKKAEAPSVFEVDFGRVLIFSYGSPDSGIPYDWAAENDISGVNFLSALTDENIEEIKQNILSKKRPNDVVVFSIHWGGNWGYDISSRQRDFAHKLINEAGVDVILGHSSHHPMGIEVYKNRLIIYGAGDFINDYEGIGGHEKYRSELSLMYFVSLDKSGKLMTLEMVPMRIRKFRLNRANSKDVSWMEKMLNREGAKLGTEVIREEHTLRLEWR